MTELNRKTERVRDVRNGVRSHEMSTDRDVKQRRRELHEAKETRLSLHQSEAEHGPLAFTANSHLDLRSDVCVAAGERCEALLQTLEGRFTT